MGRAPEHRVVVGVDISYAGLNALREAYDQARTRGARLLAVRVVADVPARPAVAMNPLWMQGIVPSPRPQPWEQRERMAHEFVTEAFDAALGTLPHTVPVDIVTELGRVGPALVRHARSDRDLIVVGAGRRRPRLRRTVAAYCAAHATCQVLVVPACEMAQHDGGRYRARRLVHHWLADTTRRGAAG